jgi:hypothetical protein
MGPYRYELHVTCKIAITTPQKTTTTLGLSRGNPTTWSSCRALSPYSLGGGRGSALVERSLRLRPRMGAPFQSCYGPVLPKLELQLYYDLEVAGDAHKVATFRAQHDWPV